MLVLASKIIWLIGPIAWFIIRLPHQRKARKTKIATSARTKPEMISLFFSGSGLGLIPAIYVFTDLFSFADSNQYWISLIFGAICFACALVLFRLTHKALGKNWSVSLDLREEHALVTEGVYRLARHPMYSAFWLWAIAQFFLLPNWVAGLSAIVCFGTLYLQRVFKEEKMMEMEFGQEYRDYCQRTGRLWPKKF